mgnify:CR=1 FL=1
MILAQHDNVLRIPLFRSFYLYHSGVRWWQPVTSLFCHGSRSHLSNNLFLLLLFGRSVEDELGWGGLVFTYLFCGVLANLASLALLPAATVSIGASGAVFGLFAVSILARLSWTDLSWQKIIEVVVLGEFVFKQVLGEMRTAAGGGVAGINHVAHLSGAASANTVYGSNSVMEMVVPGDEMSFFSWLTEDFETSRIGTESLTVTSSERVTDASVLAEANTLPPEIGQHGAKALNPVSLKNTTVNWEAWDVRL